MLKVEEPSKVLLGYSAKITIAVLSKLSRLKVEVVVSSSSLVEYNNNKEA